MGTNDATHVGARGSNARAPTTDLSNKAAEGIVNVTAGAAEQGCRVGRRGHFSPIYGFEWEI